MKNWQILGTVSLAGLGLYLLGEGYLNSRVKKAGFNPLPEESVLDKINLIRKSPYKKIQI